MVQPIMNKSDTIEHPYHPIYPLYIVLATQSVHVGMMLQQASICMALVQRLGSQALVAEVFLVCTSGAYEPTF